MVIRLASLLVALTLVFCQEDNEIVTKNFLGIGRMQAVAVSGRLICNGRPATNIKIKLYENEIRKFYYEIAFRKNITFECLIDSWKKAVQIQMDNSEFLAQNEKFQGLTQKSTFITNAIIMGLDLCVCQFFKLNVNFQLCSKKFTIKIPKDYINRGSQAERTYDIGTLNLANKYPGESTDCIN